MSKENQTYIIGNNDEVTQDDLIILYYDNQNFYTKTMSSVQFFYYKHINPLCEKHILLKCMFKYSEELFKKMARGEFNPNYDEVTLKMLENFKKK